MSKWSLIENILSSTYYCVTELDVHSDVYDQVNFNDSTITNSENKEIEVEVN